MTGPGIIYMYTSPSGRSYIGLTTNPKIRKYQHRYGVGHCTAFNLAIKKYGFDNFKYEVLHENIYSQEELDRLEIKEIQERNTLSPNGYNLRAGGGNGMASEETKHRQSISRKAAVTEEQRLRMSVIAKNRVWTDEQRREAGDRKRGIPLTNAHRKAVSESLKGRIFSAEHKSNLSKKRKSEKSQKQLEEIRKLRCKKIKCIDTGEIFNSISDANRKYKIKSIGQCLRGKSKSAGGFRWEYVNG